ncbi:unnamed protein product [Aureobasidium mustum]|uniref:Uncharacterized protein n=1 Tax=Aureobasidium mustum TaxID=2773714 RepID=A0A9N8JU29_9PEZI|nr:unnamed protein product [Aureobasidium mustum]
MDNAREFILEDVLNNIKGFLEDLTDLKVTDDMHEELSEALGPLLETMSMLPYQRWQYTFDMIPATHRGVQIPFDHSKMDGMFAEKTGMVQASLFPQLCRLEWDDQGQVSYTGDHLLYSLLIVIQGLNHTVVCKARVAVKNDPSTITDGMRQDTEMSDGIDDGTKTDLDTTEDLEASVTDLDTTEDLGADVTDKSQDFVDRERSQSKEQVDDAEKDVGEPMDEDPMTSALRAGSGDYIDLSETPEREPSEIGIPDSFDRAEEETIVQSRRWPA